MVSLSDFKSIVIKIGSALLVNEDNGAINKDWLQSVAADIAELTRSGHNVLIVSSGAIALGRTRLGLNHNTLTLAQKQACAATGQALLTQAYEQVLAPHGLITAQALLTLNDTEDRRRWINAKETLITLLKLGTVPIINENDTVATDEIRYGDNDRLAARVAQMVGADVLVLLSDVDGLYDQDPRTHKGAKFISEIYELTPEIMAMGGNANQLRGTGSGGMATKLHAAQIATRAGCTLVITKGDDPHPLSALSHADTPKRASWFYAATNSQTARKLWIESSLKPKGVIHIDVGAARALQNGKSLLAAGVVRIEGEFDKGDAVRICTEQGEECGRGLAGFSAPDCQLIKGLKSDEIERILGYGGGSAFIHRDNLVLG
ncbi:MAG TPA: glutamate 5-kinase [Hellea balneolensis]|uniref:Glutamate 5-kinase n=1 Tax=Hellea balneolensis TaxID=287478 RepID=A0A7C3C8E4_9PROT|nr:glutamate 5-kinase [Hellea balneolensis]